MKFLIALALLCAATTAQAKTFALMLNEQERAALLESLDAAVKAHGLDPVGQHSFYLFNKVSGAPEVTEQTPATPVPPPASPPAPKKDESQP